MTKTTSVTVRLDDVLDVELLQRRVEDRFVSMQRHPTEPLRIFNYTAKATYDREAGWDHVTRTCRGLIVDDDNRVVARPFPKFFGLGEHGEDRPAGRLVLPPGRIVVSDKADGSLGISYRQPSDGAVRWATRGSFTSTQAVWANEWWARQGSPSLPLAGLVTWMAEIVFPGNRIVVDYGDRETLMLLAGLDMQSGRQLCPPVGIGANGDWWPGEWVELFPVAELADVDPDDRPGAEGYVVLFSDLVTRVKVKAAEYVRLHRIVTGVSTRTVWEMLSTGQSLAELTDRVPDEFSDWLRCTITELAGAYKMIVDESQTEFDKIVGGDVDRFRGPDRRLFAERVIGSPNKAVLFRMLDGKDHSSLVWKMVRPVTTRPFTVDVDAVEEV